MPVLGPVDVGGGSTQDVHTTLSKFDGEIVGNLAADGHDHSLGSLESYDVHDPLERQFVEIESVAHVIVRGYGLGVVVDHDAPPALLADLLHAGNGAPVKLYRTAYMILSRAEDNDGTPVVLIRDLVDGGIVSEIKVIGLLRSGCREGVDALDDRDDPEGKALLPDHVLPCLRNRIFIQGDSDLTVGESLLLGFTENGLRKGCSIIESIQHAPGTDNVGEFVKEPLVDLGQVVDAVDGPAEHHRLGDVEDTRVRRIG